MSRRARLVLALLLTATLPGLSRAGCPDESPLDPPCGLAPLERLRDDFVARATRAGLSLPSPVALREATGPELVRWDAAAGAAVVPRWEELAAGQRAALSRLAGSDTGAPALFAWLYRWFFLPRALAQACLAPVATATATAGDGEEARRAADELAVAFLKEEPMGPERLEQVQGLVEAALHRLEQDGGGAAVPDAQRAALVRAKATLARREGLHFDQVAARLRPPTASRRGP
jgi:hypothetical protein